MRKVLSTVLLGFVALGGLASAQSAAPAPTRKKRIAVMDFDYATVQTNAASIFGTNVDVGKGISDLLVDDLVRNGTYSVIERQQMSKILGEQNFEKSGRVNPATAAKIGRLLGVDAIIIGAVTEFGRETKNTGIGAVGSTFHHFGFGGFGQKKTRAIVGLSARIVNVETGEIETVADAKGQSSRKSTSMLGGGGGWGGFGAGGVNFGTSNFQQTIIGEAVKKATDGLAAQLDADDTRIALPTIHVNGEVAAVVNGQVVIDVGSHAGVRVGDKLTVERVTMTIKDPRTGKVLRQMTTPVGEIEAVNVDAVSAVCNILSGGGFKVGDLAQTTVH